ncbi:MAG: hypothetical protein NC205_08315 [Prevotella sp.]|nr:hypothetical protein [Alistipes senegalensis]MCM1358587.1 hypothetical protein [Prevotella sp.]
MNGYTIKPSIEPNDKYEKARQDVFQAIKSLQELTSQQQEQLATEIFGCESVALMQRIMQQRF